jgi:hypothetical protein
LTSPKCVLAAHIRTFRAEITRVGDFIHDAARNPLLAEDNNEIRADGALRLEVRIPFKRANKVLVGIEWHEFRPWICPIPTSTWW